MTNVANVHEYAARQKKAARIIEILVRAKLTHELASQMTPFQWATVANRAGVKPPSDETKALVLDALKSMETPLSGAVQ